jgi:hypothetical protein
VEAQMIVEWLAERAEQAAITSRTEFDAWAQVRGHCRRARVIAAFVRLWSAGNRGSALQLAGAERLYWPLPAGDVDAGELMERILAWVDRQDEIVADSTARRAA